ncbi:Brain-specific angiogenesis inhibitor 1-associated protein 2 [Holothuria leucospilota]|uniref:Brain-specific angiogenesis inhibitor 1-associated protein 2 n=1 Tax=Holothuria leucospilota TaxID=206669 RepID=A0A9Q1C379_HOLLE|nr:Brain-specific angiogenesis inhibitor 1-associated protein 2 [Holothuria leucospilota]
MTTGEQLHRMTENVYRNVIDGFTPEVRTLIVQGKVYDKALQGVTQAAKEYFDAIVRVGEVASDTKGSRQLGQSLLQIAETYRQIEAERDAVVHCLRKEILLPMEGKLDLEWKYINQNQKSYLSENKSKAEIVEKRRNEVKKIQKKTQKNHSEKYLEKEQRSLDELHQLTKSLLSFRSQSLREAWCEQRKRYAYLVERYCASIKNEAAFYGKAHSVLQYRLPKWNESCEKPYKLPEECEEMLSMDFSGPLESPLHMELRNSMKMLAKNKDDSSGSEKSQSRPVSLASQEIERPLSVEVDTPPATQTFPTSQSTPPSEPPPPSTQPPSYPPSQPPPEQDQFSQYPPPQGGYISSTLPNRGKAAGGLRHSKSVMYPSPGSRNRPQVQRHVSESGDDKGIPKVRSLYNHPAAGETQLSLQEGDIVGLIGPQNNGWFFGHNYRSKRNGWFPISFTQPLDNGIPHSNGSLQQPPPPSTEMPYPSQVQNHQGMNQDSPHMPMRRGLSVSSENLSRTNGDNYPSPDYSTNDSPNHMKFFTSRPPPPSQTHGGLLISTSQQAVSQQSLHSGHDTSSGSQLSSGSITPQTSSHVSEVEKPSTPTHPPPPPPTELAPDKTEEQEGEKENPLLNVQLRKTVTDDRSAPQIPANYNLN